LNIETHKKRSSMKERFVIHTFVFRGVRRGLPSYLRIVAAVYLGAFAIARCIGDTHLFHVAFAEGGATSALHSAKGEPFALIGFANLIAHPNGNFLRDGFCGS
jgi:hypothetical protein